MNDGKPVVFDDDNPEWTEADFAAARPASEIVPPEVLGLLVRKPGRPMGWSKPNAKKSITLRLDPDVIEGWRKSGPGWQSRMNAALREAIAKPQ